MRRPPNPPWELVLLALLLAAALGECLGQSARAEYPVRRCVRECLVSEDGQSATCWYDEVRVARCAECSEVASDGGEVAVRCAARSAILDSWHYDLQPLNPP